ncbi:MAG: hypothetical protein JSS81_05510 [Acidobacteria bacterium]|nr:hypothetical protein [Acidobacteriota bacterium]
MVFSSTTELVVQGFEGFESIASLIQSNCKRVSEKRGVYCVIRTTISAPQFIHPSNAGQFKQKNPTVSVERLKKHWVESAIILYIGKSGSTTNKRTLKKRLCEFMNFGNGQPVGHWGGRFIWQLADSNNLQICWKPTLDEEPIDVERRLIIEFKEVYGKRPFANLRS